MGQNNSLAQQIFQGCPPGGRCVFSFVLGGDRHLLTRILGHRHKGDKGHTDAKQKDDDDDAQGSRTFFLADLLFNSPVRFRIPGQVRAGCGGQCFCSRGHR